MRLIGRLRAPHLERSSTKQIKRACTAVGEFEASVAGWLSRFGLGDRAIRWLFVPAALETIEQALESGKVIRRLEVPFEASSFGGAARRVNASAVAVPQVEKWRFDSEDGHTWLVRQTSRLELYLDGMVTAALADGYRPSMIPSRLVTPDGTASDHLSWHFEHVVRGRTLADIARASGVSRDAVRSGVSRASCVLRRSKSEQENG